MIGTLGNDITSLKRKIVEVYNLDQDVGAKLSEYTGKMSVELEVKEGVELEEASQEYEAVIAKILALSPEEIIEILRREQSSIVNALLYGLSKDELYDEELLNSEIELVNSIIDDIMKKDQSVYEILRDYYGNNILALKLLLERRDTWCEKDNTAYEGLRVEIRRFFEFILICTDDDGVILNDKITEFIDKIKQAIPTNHQSHTVSNRDLILQLLD
ncbi:MAG: hypothetical protein PHE25_00725 [Candidatus Gracilibacteria bacterium]|nr:hypothetical protein [Candidatus Gracilibacteria bacterium]